MVIGKILHYNSVPTVSDWLTRAFIFETTRLERECHARDLSAPNIAYINEVYQLFS